MATVKISEALRSSIRNRIDELFKKRIDRLFDPMPITPQEMYDIVFEDHIPYIKNVPMAYLTAVPNIQVTFNINDCQRQFSFEAPDKQAGFKIPAAFKHAMPAEFGLRRFHSYSSTLSGDADVESVRMAPVVAKLAPLFAEAARLYTESNATRVAIRNLLENCGTLQQAHKVYPMILELCPYDVVTKFHEKVERVSAVKEAKKELEQVDLSALTGAVVANKISGGGA